MSSREMAMQLLERVPDYKIGYVLAFIQGLTADEVETPNAVTMAAMKELENGGGESFDTLDDLWSSLEG